MILLDTNVVSELMRPRPEPRVEAWADLQPLETLFITAITEAEMRYGFAVLPPGRRKEKLAAAISVTLDEDFAGRILPFDSSAAIAFATIASERRRTGRPIAEFDAQIAAIAKSRGVSLATHDSRGFEDCGIVIIDPWAS